jgi:hypothetical protein
VDEATPLWLTTGPAALLFAAIFLLGQHFHPLRRFIRDRRSVLSFTAGMSIAYVFVRMMPELNEARELLLESADSRWLPFEGVAIYFLALLGFLGSYGLDHLREGPAPPAGEGGGEGQSAMHLGGTAAYVAMMSYLLVRSAGESVPATVGFALAFGGHFLALDHSLFDRFRDDYLRRGRWLLAASSLFGWLLGLLLVLPPLALALLLAFISGGVIMTNALMELSEGKDGRFLPFMAGALVYGLLLIPLGAG